MDLGDWLRARRRSRPADEQLKARRRKGGIAKSSMRAPPPTSASCQNSCDRRPLPKKLGIWLNCLDTGQKKPHMAILMCRN